MVAGRYPAAAAPAEPMEHGGWTQGRAPQVGRRKGRRPAPVQVRRFVATLAFIWLLLFVLGIRQATIASLGYEVVAAKSRLEELKVEQAALEAELAVLAAPERIERTAMQLGLSHNDTPRIVRVADLRPVGDRRDSGASVVVTLPHADDAPNAHLPAERPGTLTRIGAWLYAWLTGDQVQAGTLH